MARRTGADNFERCRSYGHINGTNPVTIHGRGIKRRLITPGIKRLCQHPAQSFCKGNIFDSQWLNTGKNARTGLFNGHQDHGYFAVNVPDLPPDFSTKRKSVIFMPRSTALHMS